VTMTAILDRNCLILHILPSLYLPPREHLSTTVPISTSQTRLHWLVTVSSCILRPFDWERIQQLQPSIIARNAIYSGTFDFSNSDRVSTSPLAHIIIDLS
jgi:hypothetical protein